VLSLQKVAIRRICTQPNLTYGIDATSNCRIGDLGSAFFEDSDVTVHDIFCAWSYITPEFIFLKTNQHHPDLKNLTKRLLRSPIDVWAFGLSLYRILTFKSLTRLGMSDMSFGDATKLLVVVWVKQLELFPSGDAFELQDIYDSVIQVDGYRTALGIDLSSKIDLTPIRESMIRDFPSWIGFQEKKELIRIVRWCLSFNPSDRPSMKQLLSDHFFSDWLMKEKPSLLTIDLRSAKSLSPSK
jgi:serine/threonine protein kinase